MPPEVRLLHTNDSKAALAQIVLDNVKLRLWGNTEPESLVKSN